MMKSKILNRYLIVSLTLVFVATSCSKEDTNTDIDQQTENFIELRQSAEVDMIGETVSDIIINAYEAEESQNLDRTSSSASSFLPNCVTITVLAQQGFREITLDYGTEGCFVNGHVLKGQIVFSYTRDIEALEVLINYNLIDFYFDAKQVVGSRTIFRQLSNDNGNPQFTHSLDLSVIWPNGAQASREGEIIREWIEGFGSGAFDDNVFEVTGNWTTTFINGNTHAYDILTPLRREVVCNHFVSGSVDLERRSFGGTIDYGSGDCDSLALFTLNNGNEIDIVLN